MAKRQKTQLELAFGTEGKGEARTGRLEGTEATVARADVESPAACGLSLERVVERDNLRKALAQVKRNKSFRIRYTR
jgi:RNA-directed DNA polymerase